MIERQPQAPYGMNGREAMKAWISYVNHMTDFGVAERDQALAAAGRAGIDTTTLKSNTRARCASTFGNIHAVDHGCEI